MPRPYSTDLRQRVIAACDAGTLKRNEIAQQFQISEATLYNWLRRRREAGGSAEVKPHAGGRVSSLDPAILRELVEAHNDRTLEEYVQLYAARTGHVYSVSWLYEVIERLGLTRKKRRSGPRNTSAKTSPRSA